MQQGNTVPAVRSRAMLTAYRAASFLAAFLLFLVQPMASKALLPWFGGSFVVWGACMVFFQASLLVGYSYAHTIQRQLGVRRYGRLHLLFLLAPCLVYPFDLAHSGEGVADWPLVIGVVLGLLRTVGWPFLALSTSSLVLQRWLSQSTLPERGNPYTLYAWSNLGSILGLLAYPVVLEPLLSVAMQEQVWWGGYLLFLALHLVCLFAVSQDVRGATGARHERVAPASALRWIALSAAACAALLAVTNVITFDIASVPFLWVLPLCAYLLCFVLTFKHHLWCPAWNRSLLAWLTIVATMLRLLTSLRLSVPIWLAVPLHLALLFSLCLECCAGLIRTRPEKNGQLTAFYLLIAVGGLLGSLVVSWIVPLVSTSIVEYGLAAAAGLAAISLCPAPSMASTAGRRHRIGVLLTAAGMVAAALTLLPWLVSTYLPGGQASTVALVGCALPIAFSMRLFARDYRGLALLVAVAAIAMQWTEPLLVGARGLQRLRNYYGIYKIYDQDGTRYLQHGTTQHGRQHLAPDKRHIPLAYYHPSTPGAGVLTSPRVPSARIGMIGLGAGAFAAYMEPGETMTVYELDPDNLPLARDGFTYLDDASARGVKLAFEFGDGRVSLRSAAPGSLDILIVDAFNSGSIPVHLLTAEAFKEYRRVVGRDGLILLHVSNKMLNLMPVVYNTARAAGLQACENSLVVPETPDADPTWWMAVAEAPGVLGYIRISQRVICA